MANIHDLARKFLSQEKAGLHFSDPKRAAVMLFADWLLVNGYAAQQKRGADFVPAGFRVVPTEELDPTGPKKRW